MYLFLKKCVLLPHWPKLTLCQRSGWLFDRPIRLKAAGARLYRGTLLCVSRVCDAQTTQHFKYDFSGQSQSKAGARIGRYVDNLCVEIWG